MRLSRRELLILAGASSSALCTGGAPWLAAAREQEAAAPRCVLTPRQTEGPYFVDERLERADLRSDPQDGSICEGTRLELALRIHGVRDRECTPVEGAIVDLWHCDARGIYSGVRDPLFRTDGSGFLRGFQRTDASGRVRFTTIYPGWYPGRAVHVHFKVTMANEAGRALELTSQLYFDDAVTQRVYNRAPYAQRSQAPRNRQDWIYRDGGSALTLTPTEEGEGYAARFDVGLALG